MSAAPATGNTLTSFTVDSKQFAGISTESFIAAMNAEGIPNQASYPPLHDLHMFRNGEYRKRLSGAQATAEHAFLRQSFPQHPTRGLGNSLDSAACPAGRRNRYAGDCGRDPQNPGQRKRDCCS